MGDASITSVFPKNYTAGDQVIIDNATMVSAGFSNHLGGLTFVLPKDNVLLQNDRNINQSPDAIQMVTASNIINGEETFGFLLSGIFSRSLRVNLDKTLKSDYVNAAI